MARVMKQFDFAVSGTPMYDWDKWLDGRIWQLTKGEDFTISCASFRIQAQSVARKRRLKLRTKGHLATLSLCRRLKKRCSCYVQHLAKGV